MLSGFHPLCDILMSIHPCINAVISSATLEPFLVQIAQPAARSPLLYLREDELDNGVSLILDSSKALLDMASELAAPHGLAGPELRVFLAARKPSGIGVLALAASLGITKQGLLRILEQTDALGFTERRRDPNDGRGRLVSLTSKGRAVERTIGLALRERLARAYRKAGSDAVTGAHSVLRAVLDDSLTGMTRND
jgi:DNA-binding MarR family transcriptional regulator